MAGTDVDDERDVLEVVRERALERVVVRDGHVPLADDEHPRGERDRRAELRARLLQQQLELLAQRARIFLAEPSESTRAEDLSMLAAELGLTAREAEVLELVARGYTNREIGEALYVSVKTASVHVSHILRELGVSSRVEAAAAAHRVARGK
jgi:DNA-binding NarL/FixJ family response regulator